MTRALHSLDELLDPDRLAALRETGLLDTDREETFDRFTRLAARLLDAPSAVLALVTEDRQFFKSDFGLDPSTAHARGSPLAMSLCKHVVIRHEALQVHDVRTDPDVDVDRSSLARQGVVAYAGAPIVTSEGHVIGTLGVVDRRPRAWTPREMTALEDLAAAVTAEIELRIDVKARERAEDALTESRKEFRLLLESAPVPLVVHRRGRILFVNRELVRLVRAEEAGALLGRSVFEFVSPEDHEAIRRRIERVERFQAPVELRPQEITRDDGTTRWVEVKAIPVPYEGEPSTLLLLRDVTEAKHSREALEASERSYRQLFERNVAGVFRSTLDGTLVEANEAFADMLGFPDPEAVRGTDAVDLYDDPALRNGLVRILEQEGRIVNQEIRVRGRDGKPRWLLVTASLIDDRESEERQILGTVFDITDRKRIEEKLRRRALFDEMTELPNRSLFEDRLRHAMARLRRGGRREAIAVLFVDLDRFKVVNDSLGHERGDRVLACLAQRLAQTSRDEDTVARFGGDEFTILLEDLSAREDAVRAADRLAGVFDVPFTVSGEEFTLSASIGIALHDGSGEVEPGDLIRRADIAMYRAKEIGGTSYYILDPGTDTAETTRLQRETDLRRAVREDRFRLFYQPIYDLADGSLLGAEALVRWEHRERGVVPPAEFIPLAEETGQIVELGERILEMACREHRAWCRELEAAPPALRVFVNLSPRQLAEHDFVDRAREILDATQTLPDRVCLEVTESLLTEASEGLRELRALGFKVAVDDFGTGYSSLAYLGRLTVDALKIDSSFVQGLVDDPRNQAIVQSIVTLGETLGLEVIAEGIERPEQADVIRHLGCRAGQGFLFERPLEAAAFRALAGAGRSR